MPLLEIPSLEQQIAQTIERVQRTGRIEVPGQAPLALEHHVNTDEGAMLRDVVEQRKLKRTIEIGMGTGISGLYICWGLARAGGGEHLAIDPFQTGQFWQGRGLALRDQAGCTDMFHWLDERDDDILPRLWKAGKKFDLALIDGDHRFEAALLDFYYLDKMLPIGGICAFDDTDWPSVWRVVEFALHHRSYRWVAAVPIDQGPWTRPWGWKLRARRWHVFRRNGWSLSEALRRRPYQFVVLEKTCADDRPEHF